MLGRLSNRDAIRFDEKYVKLVFLTYLMMNRAYLVKSEYEVEEGYIDIAMFKRMAEVKFEAIIEVKFIKATDVSGGTDSLRAQKLAEAKAQLAKYETSEELRTRPNLAKFVVIFVGSEGEVIEVE